MEITLKPGKYVVAVSGGVDSVVLLDMLARQQGLELIVAHLDHGIREDSPHDVALVEQLAAHYNLPVEVGYAELGEDASEAEAREARYRFLGSVRKKHKADAIVTGHHEDDLVETALINLVRGTGPRGLSALKNKPDMLRPLLQWRKHELVAYAREHNLNWREDSTNRAVKYLRNYIRHKVLPLAAQRQPKFHEDMLTLINKTAQTTASADEDLFNIVQQFFAHRTGLPRHTFIMLPHIVAKEVMATIMRTLPASNFDKKLIERLTIAVKAGAAGSQHDIDKHWKLELERTEWSLVQRSHLSV